MTELQEGDPAPDFSLPSSSGDTISLRDLRGHDVVLYFYPKDDTPGCTKEACSFRDSYAAIQQMGPVLLGVSPDDVSSHQRFVQKYHLPFPLLADTDRRVAEAYGVWKEKSMYGKTYMGVERSTFLIDKEGRIAHVWRRVNPEAHAGDVLAAVAPRGT